MSSKAEVHKYIETEIRPGATVLLKAHEAQTDKFRQVLFSITDAIQKSDERMIKLYLKALTAHKDGEKESVAQWAIQEAWIRKQLELAKRRLPEIEKLSEKAKRAAAERNEKALEEAQKASAELRDTDPTFKEVEEDFEKF